MFEVASFFLLFFFYKHIPLKRVILCSTNLCSFSFLLILKQLIMIMTEGRDILHLQHEDDSSSISKSRNPSTTSIHPLCGPNTEIVFSDEPSSLSSSSFSTEGGGGSVISPTFGSMACKCKPGYDGNPLDMSIGCKKSSKLRLMCEYKNKSYGIEETFFDGCEKKCICSEALEVDCLPRCPSMDSSSTGYPSNIDPLCSWVEDPKDSCCKVLACESQAVSQKAPHPSSLMTTPAPSVSSPPTPVILQSLLSSDHPPLESSSLDFKRRSSSSPMSGSSSSSSSSSSNSGGNTPTANHSHRADGCRSESNPGVYRRKGEVFFVGCDSKCVCTHSGVIQCEPRCSLFQGEYIKLLLFFDVLQYILNQKPHNNIRGETKTSSTNLRH